MVNDRSKYDRRGQLLSVCDADGRTLESYRYDAAGNIVDKRVLGVHTEYTYDAANQLIKSVTNGVITKYAYDAAGRMIKEGDREYSYSGLDKVDEIRENGKVIALCSYHTDGQLAVANYGNGKSEEFTWDGLALIGRNEVGYLNEPSVTGGNPISANGQTMFNDMLGSTLGISNGKNFSRTVMTSFGAYGDESSFYTGKPKVDGLGYTFNYRNYRADQGKWQTADPLGYPDGFNNYAYVNNGVTDKIDYLGLEEWYFKRPSRLSYTQTFNIQIPNLIDYNTTVSYSINGFVPEDKYSDHMSINFSVCSFQDGLIENSFCDAVGNISLSLSATGDVVMDSASQLRKEANALGTTIYNMASAYYITFEDKETSVNFFYNYVFGYDADSSNISVTFGSLSVSLPDASWIKYDRIVFSIEKLLE